MNTLMQREDFLALCPGPENGGVFVYHNAHASGYGRTHDGMGHSNQLRVLNDWFPAGEIFQFLGTTCFSRGPEIERTSGLGRPQLRVLAPSPKGGMEEVVFSVKEALNIARQVSVDRVNFLNDTLPNK